jgi:hypothetical protein
MPDEGEFFICETCRQRIDPNAAGTVIGVEMTRSRTMGGEPEEWIEGLRGYFHARCTSQFGRVAGDRKWVPADSEQGTGS